MTDSIIESGTCADGQTMLISLDLDEQLLSLKKRPADSSRRLVDLSEEVSQMNGSTADRRQKTAAIAEPTTKLSMRVSKVTADVNAIENRFAVGQNYEHGERSHEGLIDSRQGLDGPSHRIEQNQQDSDIDDKCNGDRKYPDDAHIAQKHPLVREKLQGSIEEWQAFAFTSSTTKEKVDEKGYLEALSALVEVINYRRREL